MGKNIPGLNFNSKLSVDDLNFYDQQLEEAILSRFKLTIGASSLASSRHGIVDAVDPKNLVETETTRSLIVYPSVNNPLRVNISPGVAVTPNGSIVRLTNLIEDFEIARTNANDINIIFAENEIQDSPPNRLTRYNILQPVRRLQNTSIIRSVLLSDFNNSVLFPPTRLENIVCLAVIVIADTVSGLELQIDYTDNTYLFNRPWFSAVDIEHRSRLGSGVSTETNPHGLTFNDLVSGQLTLYDQLLKTGLILARDEDLKGIPGKLCQEIIEPSRVLVDGGGNITAGSRFGGVNAKYVVLSSYPTKISAFYLESHKGRAIAFDHIEGTRIVVLPSPEGLEGTSVVKYNQVFAGMPPLTIFSNTLVFSQPDTTNELIVSGGVSLDSLSNPSIDVDGSGPVPRNYKVYLTGDGSLLRSPQMIQAPFRLVDIGSALTPISFSIFGPAKITIGLADANPVPTMSITLRVFGRDGDGVTISEDITFAGSSWVHVPIPGPETPAQLKTTETVFYEVTHVQVLNRVDDGPSSAVVMWADLETGTTLDLNKLAMLATFTWNGASITNLKDARKVVANLPERINRYLASAELAGLGNTGKEHVLTEDFSSPQYRDSTKGYQEATHAKFSIFVDDYTLIQTGDTIEFPNGKTITAITTGSPNRTLGEYLATTSDADTKDEIIATINFPAFNSGVVAATDDLNPVRVNCTMVIKGSRGNGEVSEPVQANVNAISLSGDAEGGIDAFGESFTPRHMDHIESTIPSTGVYEVYNLRERYLSKPIAIGLREKLTILLHGTAIPRSSNYLQVRVRVANEDSEVWLPWEVATDNGAVFTVEKSFNISKAQIEIFGKCSGFSLYEGDA
jgi:hypothetical protein